MITHFPVDKTPMVVITNFSNQDYAPNCLHPDWANPKPGVVLNALKNAGSDRVMLWQPAGRKQDSAYVGLSQWYTMTDAMRETLREELSSWKGEKAGRKFGIYLSVFFNDPFTLVPNNVHPFDINELQDRRAWMQTFLNFFLIGVDEIFLDAGSLDNCKQAVHDLASYAKPYGIVIGTEAIPIVKTLPVTGFKYDPDVRMLDFIPALCFHPFLASYDWEKWQFGDNHEVHCILIPPATDIDVEKLNKVGFIVGYNNSVFKV